MRKKKKTIILAKIRRHLRQIARRKYLSGYAPEMDEDVSKIAKKIYELI